MKVAGVMQKNIVTVSPNLPLGDLEDVLTSDEISGVPVFNDNTGKVVGVVTKSDLVRFWSETYGDEFRERLGEGTRVEDIMTPQLVTASPGDDVRDVAKLMLDNHVHRVVVMHGDEMQGIVTSLDLLRALI